MLFFYKNNVIISNIITNSGITTLIKIFIIKWFSTKSYARNYIRKHAKKIIIASKTTCKISSNIDSIT